MSSAPDLPPAPQRLAVDYIHAPGPQALLGMSETLAVFGFGALAPSSAAIDDPRYLHVPLSPLREAAAPYEVWRSAGPVATGREGAIRYSHDGALMFGVLEWEEPDGGILHASAHAYAALVAFWRDSDYPHLLRIWNYFDAITLGEGDSERYRQFCVGRVQGLGDVDTRTLPAATAIGSRDGRRVLQVYWLAAREPGLPLENPRQVSAYRYPRQYGPQAPSFARAMLPPAKLNVIASAICEFAPDWPMLTLLHATGEAHSDNVICSKPAVSVSVVENDCANVRYQLMLALSTSITPPPAVLNL